MSASFFDIVFESHKISTNDFYETGEYQFSDSSLPEADGMKCLFTRYPTKSDGYEYYLQIDQSADWTGNAQHLDATYFFEHYNVRGLSECDDTITVGPMSEETADFLFDIVKTHFLYVCHSKKAKRLGSDMGHISQTSGFTFQQGEPTEAQTEDLSFLQENDSDILDFDMDIEIPTIFPNEQPTYPCQASFYRDENCAWGHASYYFNFYRDKDQETGSLLSLPTEDLVEKFFFPEELVRQNDDDHDALGPYNAKEIDHIYTYLKQVASLVRARWETHLLGCHVTNLIKEQQPKITAVEPKI